MKKLFYMLLFFPIAASASITDICSSSVGIAHDAYIAAVFDAKYPDMKRVRYMIDLMADELPVSSSRSISYRTADYVAKRLKDMGVRRVSPMMVTVAAGEIGPQLCASNSKEVAPAARSAKPIRWNEIKPLYILVDGENKCFKNDGGMLLSPWGNRSKVEETEVSRKDGRAMKLIGKYEDGTTSIVRYFLTMKECKAYLNKPSS